MAKNLTMQLDDGVRAVPPSASGTITTSTARRSCAGYFVDIEAEQLAAMIDAIGMVHARPERASGEGRAFFADEIAQKVVGA
jgi:hypothetical protein